MALRTFVKCCPLLVTGLDHPSLALEGWPVGIVVLAWTLDPDVLLSEGPKHQDAIRLLVLPMGRWVWGSARKRHLSVRYRKLGKSFAVEIFATRLVIPSGEDEVLFGSHDTQIIRVQ